MSRYASAYSGPSTRIGEEGLPLILAGLAVTSIALGAIIYWGIKNKAEKDAAALQASG